MLCCLLVVFFSSLGKSRESALNDFFYMSPPPPYICSLFVSVHQATAVSPYEYGELKQELQ